MAFLNEKHIFCTLSLLCHNQVNSESAYRIYAGSFFVSAGRTQMGYNHGLEKKKFDAEWQKNEKLYRELGMTDEQITAIWEFDYKTFRSDRAYFEKKTDLSEYEETLQSDDSNIDECNIEENWHEYITDIDKRRQLSELRPEQRRAYYLCKIMNMKQEDVSSILLIPRRTISFWIVKIADILK